MTLQEKSVSIVGPRKNCFCTIIFKMASTSYNAEDVLHLLEDNSEFPDSVSSGKEGDDVYSLQWT